MDTQGKVALVTGGARMGKAVAEALARAGCDAVVAYRRSRSAAMEAVRAIVAQGRRAKAAPWDALSIKSSGALVEGVVKDFGRLDILVNMASDYGRYPIRTLMDPSLRKKAFSASIGADLGAAYHLSLAAAPPMRKAGGGRIVHFSDWVAASGRPRYEGYTPYYTAKAGVKALVESLALELAPDILVNAIAPGPILPPKGMSRKSFQEVVANTPLGRWGGPDEISKAVLFLVQSDFVTGETVRVDGGRHLY